VLLPSGHMATQRPVCERAESQPVASLHAAEDSSLILVCVVACVAWLTCCEMCHSPSHSLAARLIRVVETSA